MPIACIVEHSMEATQTSTGAERTTATQTMATHAQVLMQESPADRFADDTNQQQQQQQQTITEPSTVHNYTDLEDTILPKTTMSTDNTECSNSSGISISINNHDNDESQSKPGSYWDVVTTLYVPLILLWFRRSMFGPANLIRSIVVGQLMRIVFLDDISEWVCEKIPSWLEGMLFPLASSSSIENSGSGNSCSAGHLSTVLGGGKSDPHAWPPPALTGLALLTIFALVVHPDGLTWILLGKLRDAISAGFSALGRCLELVINDYGIFPTIIAFATLAGMFFLVFVVLRTLSPKPKSHHSKPPNHHSGSNAHGNERKKKKKKGGNARHRRGEHHIQHHHSNNHRSNRIKYSSSSSHPEAVEDASSSTEARTDSPLPSPPPSALDKDESSSSSSSSPPLSNESSADDGSNNGKNNSQLHLPSLVSSNTIATIASSTIDENTKPMVVTSNENDFVTVSAAKSNHNNNNRTRRRMMSGSTMDTTPLSDDQSCGSTSVRSYPSVSVNSNRSGGGKAGHNNKHNNNKNNNSNGKGSVNTPRRGKRNGTLKSPKHNNNNNNHNSNHNNGKKIKNLNTETIVSSRWDALKPSSNNAGNGNNGYSHHHHHHHHHNHNNNNNNNNNSNGNKKQSRFQRGGNGRRGPGGNGNGSNNNNNNNNNRKQRANNSNNTNAQNSRIIHNDRPTASSSASNTPRSKVHDLSPVVPTISGKISSPTTMTTSSVSNHAVAAATATASPALNLNSYTASPRSNHATAPPPGFQTFGSASEEKMKKNTNKNADLYASYQRPQLPPSSDHKNNNNDDDVMAVPSLFDTPPLILTSSPVPATIAPSPSSPHYSGGVGVGVGGVVPVASSQTFLPSVGFGASFDSPTTHGGVSASTTTTTKIHENPFRTSTTNNNMTLSRYQQEHLDSQIEADLQELGGQMAGSILDF